MLSDRAGIFKWLKRVFDHCAVPPGRSQQDVGLFIPFYLDDGEEVYYAINKHVWHAIQHEVNQRLGWHVWNWEVFAARIAQRGANLEKKDNPLSDGRHIIEDVTSVAKQQLSDIKNSADKMVKVTRVLLKELPKSFIIVADFAFSNYLPKEFIKSLRETDILKDISNYEIICYARMMRNLFDESDGVVKKDSFEMNFLHLLGKNLNRLRLGPRLDSLHKEMVGTLRNDEGTVKTEDEQKVSILDWGKQKRLLLHLSNESYIFDSDKSHEYITARPLIRSFLDTWGSKNILDAIEIAKKAKGSAKFISAYPRFSKDDFPVFGRAFKVTRNLLIGSTGSSGEEDKGSLLQPTTETLEKAFAGEQGETPEGKGLSRDELLLAVMKALVLDLEQKEASYTEKKINSSRITNLKIKILKMIYAHETLLDPEALGLETEQEKYYSDMSNNSLPVYGLRFLIDVPVILPSIAFARALGWAVSDVIRNPYVIIESLESIKIADKIPEKVIQEINKEGETEESGGEKGGVIEDVLEKITEVISEGEGESESGGEGKTPKGPWTLKNAEAYRSPGFNATRKNFGDAVQEVLSIFAAGHAFGATKDDWVSFSTEVAKAWNERISKVKNGDREVVDVTKIFKPLLKRAEEGFKDFASVLENKLNQMEDGTIRSLYQDTSKDVKSKPLPLWLSSDNPTLGLMLPFSQIEQYIDAGVVIPLEQMVRNVKHNKNWEWKIDVRGDKRKLITVFPPHTIPFCIECTPLTEKDAKDSKVDKFFEDSNKNPIHQEVDIDSQAGKGTYIEGEKIDTFKGRYETRLKKIERKIVDILKRMHTMRQFELDIKRRLIRRRAMIAMLIKTGLDTNKIESTFFSIRPAESWFSPLTEEEGDIIDKFLSKWDIESGSPEDVIQWMKTAKEIKQDKPWEPGRRLDAYLSPDKSKDLAGLLGLEENQIRTWDTKESSTSTTSGQPLDELSNALGKLIPASKISTSSPEMEKAIKITRRAIQIQGLLDFQISRFGFELRKLRAQREFFQQNIAQIKMEKDKFENKSSVGNSHKITQKILDLLRRDALYKAYSNSDFLPCFISIGKGTPTRIQTKEGKKVDHVSYEGKGRLMRRFYAGASIMGFQIQVPQYPSMAVNANVRFRAKSNPSYFASVWNGHTASAKLDTDVFLGLDINRLDCPRTITPVLVRNTRGVPEIKSSDDLRTWDLNLDSWSTLTDLCSYEVDNNQITPKAYKYIGLNKRSGIPKTKLIEPAREFREKILSSVFIKEGNAWKRTEPTESLPYDVDNPSNEEKIDFLDEVGALMKYWGHKHSHLERKKGSILRKMMQIRTDNRRSDDWRHWLRLRTELYFLDQRSITIRNAILQYLFRVVQYCQMRSGAKYVAHEGLSLNPGEGDLGRIVSSMLKDFSPVKDYLIHQFRTLGRKGSQMPVYKSVSPAYTSKLCNLCGRRGVKGTLDDRADSEWAICDTCENIYDRHRNAAINIGDRAVKKVYGKKNKNGKDTNPKEKS